MKKFRLPFVLPLMLGRELFFITAVLILGCSTVTRNQNSSLSNENQSDVVSAVGAVAGAMSGQAMNAEGLKKVARDIQRDAGARSAVQEISGSLHSGRVVGKYCPVDGQHYDARFTLCPVHHVELKPIEE